MKKLFFLSTLIPALTFASIGDELDALLENFFGGEKKEAQIQKIEEVEIPAHPTPENLKEVREQIFWEEEGLEQTEQEINLSNEKLQDTLQKKHTLQTQLHLMDANLGQVTKNLKELAPQEQKWKYELEQLTREKSDIAALLRAQTRDYENFLQKNYLQNENFGTGEGTGLLNWLFSTKTVSQILEDKKRQKRFEEQKKSQLEKLNILKKEMDKKERALAALYGKIESLRTQMFRQKKAITDLTENKAKTIAHLEYEEGKKQRELDNLKRQRKESTHTLQQLKTQMEKIKEKLIEGENVQNTDSPIFEFPLKIRMKVMAEFRDEDYEREFGIQHDGVDFFAPQGTDIFAPADGIVTKTVFDGFGYAYLILEHPNGFHTVYGHVSDILVNEGQEVTQGDLIGKTGGASGIEGSGYFTSGEHLHFEVLKDGKFLDPMRFLK